MSVFSKFLSLTNGAPRTVDLSQNTLATLGLQLNGSVSGSITQLASATTTPYSVLWPAAQGAMNSFLKNDGSGNLTWATVTSGTVTSVAFADDSSTPIYSVSGSPITSSGTIGITLQNQSANTVLAGPASGSAAQPTFRALVANDIPTVGASNTISNSFVAGQSYTANTSYIVRWGMNALGENATRVYAADYSTASFDEFWALGIALSATNVNPGQSIQVSSFGLYTLGSSDTSFNTSDIGNPVWLTSSGAFSTTAPSGTNEADLKIGIVVSTTQIWIDGQMMGVGTATGAGPVPLTVPQGGTGVSSFTAYSVICGGVTSTGQLQNVSGLGTSGYVLTSNGPSALPSWQAGGSSLTFADSLVNTSGTVTLVNDSATPGNSKYYGTNSGGTLGYYSIPTGSVTSVALSDGSSTPIYSISGSPVTSSGTLTLTLETQSANTVFAGPASGSAAQPTFRSLVSADIPNNAANTTGTASNITATSNSTLTTLSALSLPTSQLSGTVSLTTQASGTLQAGQFPALTGDITTTAGSLATTLATVNSNTGSFGSSTSIPSFTVNAKGLITAASGNAVVAPAGTLSGTTLNSTVVSSSLTSVGTIGTGTWQGTTIAIAHGGTGQTSASAAFNVLSPITATGDLIVGNGINSATNLPIGSGGQVLTVSGGTAAWVNASAANSGNELQNLGLAASVTSNALTINLKQSDGATDPAAAPNNVIIGTRSSTASSGAYNLRSVTSALSITVPSGASLGQTSAINQYVWVYALDNSGTIELAVSGVHLFPDGSIQSTTAISSSATSGTTLYSTTARTNVAIRIIGRMLVNETTAGTWASSPTEIDINPDITVTTTDWSSSIVLTPDSNSFGTVTNTSCISRRVGDTIFFKGYFRIGTAQSNAMVMDLPSGIVPDFNKVVSDAMTVGTWFGSTPSGTATNYTSANIGMLFCHSNSTSVVNFAFAGASAVPNVTTTANWNGGTWGISYDVSFPVSGWSTYGP